MMKIVGFCFLLWIVVVDCNKLHDIIRQRQPASNLEKLVAESENAATLLNERGPGGQTPLMMAVLSGVDEAVRVLLEIGADCSIGEKDGYTPLHGAGFQGRANIAKMLLEHGLDPLEFHQDGYAPVHRACWGHEQRHVDTVRVFLENGVPANFKTREGVSLIDTTRNPATKKLIEEFLKQAGKTEL